MHKGLEAQLQDRMSEDLTLMQTMGQQQQQDMLNRRLAALQEQQEQTQESLEGDLSALMNAVSPGKLVKNAVAGKSYNLPPKIVRFRPAVKCLYTACLEIFGKLISPEAAQW